MSSNLPVVLGGSPVRQPGSYRTTPEVDQTEVDYMGAQVLTREWNPGGTSVGIPVADGLELPEPVLSALGAEHAALAVEFAQVHAPGFGARVVPCDNGTHTIRLFFAMLAKVASELGLRTPEVGDEVIVPSLTWKGSVTPILNRNLVPVYVDVLPGTGTIDPDAAAAAVTDRTVAILGVDLLSKLFDRRPLLELVQRLQAALYEDIAQSVGAVFDGSPTGTIGHGGSVSKQGSKPLSSEEGGLFIAGALADPVVNLVIDQYVSAVTCGRPVGAARDMVADNDRMPAAIAALGRAQLLRFPEQNALRREVFARLDDVLRELPGVSPLDHQPEATVPATYKAPFRVNLAEWPRGMTLDKLRVTVMADTGAHTDRTYVPLAGDPARAAGYPNQLDPHSDPARNINPDYWERIDRRLYDTPVAWELFDSVLAIEHAAGLDRNFPDAFAEAWMRAWHHAPRIAREVRD